MGPRAIRNQKRYFQQALHEKEKEQELKSLQMLQDTHCLYESTAAAAQKHSAISNTDMNTSCENSSIKNVLSEAPHAITFWSDHLLQPSSSSFSTSLSSSQQESEESDEPNQSNLIQTKRTSFAKCTSLTNDPYS